MAADDRRPFEGMLNKFTNVVKGWQFRFFVLDPDSGRLEYYLPEDRDRDRSGGAPPRGSQHVSGAVVIPSDEDSLTFHVNLASGDVYRLRAATVRDRQVWVDRIRAVAQRHDAQTTSSAAAALGPRDSPLPGAMPPTPPGSRSHISNGEPSDALQHLSLTVIDAFGSVHDILHQAEVKNSSLFAVIESLPAASNSKGPRSLDHDLLLLKATSNAALLAMESALAVLQDYRELNYGPMTVSAQTPKPPRFSLASPMGSSPKRSSAAAPASMANFVSTGSNAMSQFFAPSPTRSSKSLSLARAKDMSNSTSSLPHVSLSVASADTLSTRSSIGATSAVS